jgi:hypothetical protein
MTTEYITYEIEDNLDFYKQLDENSVDSFQEDNTKLCLITQQPLEESHVVLNCGHCFNYDAIFKDVYNHKKKHYTLDSMRLRDYQIRCPYCRNVQNQLLPYYKGYRRVHGVNSSANMVGEIFINMKYPLLYHIHYKDYAKGHCCYDVDNIQEMIANPQNCVKCIDSLVKYNEIDERVYCKKHFKQTTDDYFKQQTTCLASKVRQEKRQLARIKKLEKKIQNEKKKLCVKLDSLQLTAESLKDRKNALKNEYKSSGTLLSTDTHTQLDNVIIGSSSFATSGEYYDKPQYKCIAFTCSNKNNKKCSYTAVKGSVYCTRHKNMFGTIM